MPTLPPYVPQSSVAERLPRIFPEGIPNRGNCIGPAAANTVFTALYIGAVEKYGRDLGPVHTYRMTDEQAKLASDADRDGYYQRIRGKKPLIGTSRWYADNSREQIRDSVLKNGLVAIGAIVRRAGMATTSSVPRYALKNDFAALFDPVFVGTALDDAMNKFRSTHLSKSALDRVAIMLSGATGGKSKVLVNFPSGETRHLEPGPSSVVAKAVVEVFAPTFLDVPVVVWLSESGNKVVVRDDKIAAQIGLKIDPKTTLPDLILVDLGPPDPLLVFVEVVATDGAINETRKHAFYEITDAGGFDRSNIAFVSAFQDRQKAGFKKTGAHLAWGSFAWFVSEPANIIIMRGDEPIRLSQLLSEIGETLTHPPSSAP